MIFYHFLMPVIQCIVAQWRHISSESSVALLLHMCSISIKCDAKLMAWDILLVLTFVAGNLCNKCPSGYSNKTAVKVIFSMRSLVSIEQQSPRRPCNKILIFDRNLAGALTVFNEDSVSSFEIPWRDILQDLHEPWQLLRYTDHSVMPLNVPHCCVQRLRTRFPVVKNVTILQHYCSQCNII